MAVDISNELSYEYLTMCIQEFEDAALKSGRRSGYLAVANGATYAADLVLDTHEKSLNRVSDTRKILHKEQDGELESQDGLAAGTVNKDENSGFLSKLNNEGISLVDKDVDLNRIFGNGGDSAFANYLEDCIGCSLRLKFDWQLKPLNFLAPINAFLDVLEGALNTILSRIDPWRILQDLCWALDHLKTLCPQDLIIVLLALKMLLKKYLLQIFNIRLDWTVLLGPLLNAIISAITDLLDNIFALLMAPLDCVVSGLVASNELLKASQQFLATIQSAGTQVGNYFDSVEKEGFANATTDGGGFFKDVSWSEPDKGDPLAFFNTGEGESPLQSGNQGYDPGKLEVKSKIAPTEPPENALRVPAGFVLKNDATLGEALKDPNFSNSTFLDKLIIPIREALAWLKETYENFVGSLKSVGELVGGGLSLSLENLGIMIFITDMISLVMMIIELLGQNVNVKDWCSFLKDNPQAIQQPLRANFGNLRVDARRLAGQENDIELIIQQGPKTIGVIKTCVNNRTEMDNTLLNQWVAELESKGAS